MSNVENNHDKVNLLKFFMGYYGRYYDHEETMAWVATALYLGGIMYLASYLRSAYEGGWWWKVGWGLFIACACFFGLCFVYWQFEKRWRAHVNVYRISGELRNGGPEFRPISQVWEVSSKKDAVLSTEVLSGACCPVDGVKTWISLSRSRARL